MESTIVNLIIQVVAGALGGTAAGASLKDLDLGTLWNTIVGAIGGAGGGQILSALIPALAGAAGSGLDVGAIVGQGVGGGASGAVLTAIIGLIKNMVGQQARYIPGATGERKKAAHHISLSSLLDWSACAFKHAAARSVLPHVVRGDQTRANHVRTAGSGDRSAAGYRHDAPNPQATFRTNPDGS